MHYPHEEIERLEQAIPFSVEGYIQVKRKDLLTVLKVLKNCQNEDSYLAIKETAAHG